MSNQLQATGAVKVRSLTGVITGTTGVLGSLPINGSLGIPQLDVNGKILVSQLPNSVMEYLGTWDASTNTPTLANGTGNAGDVYLCNVAGTVNFGAGPISFVVSDQVIYSGSIWQKASGSNGTVTSVAVTESGDALTITGSPITTSGTINIGFAGTNLQYINGQGNLTTFPSIITEAQKLVTEVYNETGATLTKGTVVYINGGHGNLPTITKAIATGDATSAQTYGVVQTDITNMNNGYVVVIGSLGDLDTQAYANGTQLYLSSTTAGAWTSTKQYAPAHLVYVAIVTRSHPTQGVVEVRIQNGFEMDELHNVSAQSPTNNQGLFYNTSTSLWENKSIATALGYTPVGGSGSVGQVAFFNGGSTTLGGSANFYWDNSTSRLGIGSNTPNASLGILNSSSTGIQVRTSDSANQYQANIFYDASYGMVYGYNRLGSGTASNLTFFNNIGGFISIPESATNNIGFNTINPQGLAGASVYDFTSLNTNVELRLHNSSTGYTSTDGSFIRVTSTALVIANAETSKSIFINNGGLEVITIDATNKVAIGSVGVVPMTQQLTVIGSIEAYGGSIYQTVTSSMLKANASGQIIAAIAGTDYLAVGSAVTSVSATSPILSSGGTTPNISIPAATTSVSGYLTSTDWTTFNNKGTFSLPSLTSGSVLFSNGSTIAQDNANFFWDDVNNRLGIGTSSPTEILHILGASAIVYIDGNSAGTQTSATLRLRTGGFNVGNFRYNVATDNIEISNVSAGGAVTSGAVKIYGTSGSTTGLTIAAAGGGSFASTLTVGTTAFITNDIFIGDTTSGSGRFFITDSSNQGITLRRTGATGDRFKMFVGNGTTYTQDNAIILGTNTDIDFYTGASPLRRMTIANGGNVGINTNTPTATLHIVSPVVSAGTALKVVSDGNGNDKVFEFTGADGVAAQTMTMLQSGNVGIGTNVPSGKLHLSTTSDTYFVMTGGATPLTYSWLVDATNLRLFRGVGDTTLLTISSDGNILFGFAKYFQWSADTSAAATRSWGIRNNETADGDFAIKSSSTNNNTLNTTRLVITSGGNVGIGTSSPYSVLDIKTASSGSQKLFSVGEPTYEASNYGLVLRGDNNTGIFAFYGVNATVETTAPILAMRRSSGNVSIGDSGSSNVRLQIKSGGNTSASYAIITRNSAITDLFVVRDDGVFNTGNASLSPYNNGFTGRTAQIASNGELGYLSSTRESKSNIESIKNVDFINQLNPVQFNYRKKDNVTHKFTDELYNNISYGFIADEVEKVNKELAFYNEDGTLAGVEYNSMIAILTKAVQELKAEIEILKNK